MYCDGTFTPASSVAVGMHLPDRVGQQGKDSVRRLLIPRSEPPEHAWASFRTNIVSELVHHQFYGLRHGTGTGRVSSIESSAFNGALHWPSDNSWGAALVVPPR